MKGSTILLLVLGLAGAGGAAYYFLVVRKRDAATVIATGPGGIQVVAQPPVPTVGGGGILSADHATRKNAVAPYVLSAVGVPGSITRPVAAIAAKLDVSAYAQRAVEKVPVVGTVVKTATAVPAKVAGAVVSVFKGLF